MLVLLNIILLAVVASCSDPTIRPAALCNFDQHTCGWTNDPSSSLHPWKIQHRPPRGFPANPAVTYPILCFSANTQAEEDKDSPSSFSSWLTVPRKPLVKKPPAGDLRARLWSPTVPAALGLRCLKFSYAHLDHSTSSRLRKPSNLTTPALALLKQADGSCRSQSNSQSSEDALICVSSRLWRSSSPTSDGTKGWTIGSVDLPVHQGVSDYKLILEGTIPAGYPDARICVDNITSYTEPCSALEPKPIKPVSSLNWAHYFGMIFIAALALGLIIPILFLVIIIFVCRRRHQYRHSNFANSKLFSTNLWHYIGGKEVSEDPFAEHTASFHRPPFMGNKFVGDGTLAMRNGDMMDLPDVVIPGGRVVAMGYNGGTLGPNGTMRHQSASFNGYPYGSSTMTMGAKPMMGQPGMGYMQSPMTPNMATSQHNAQTMFQPAHFYNGNVDHMQPQQQAAQPPQPVQGTVANNQPPRVQSGPVQQSAPAVVPPSNYFRSLTQAAEDHPAPVAHAGQPAAAANQPVAHPPVSINDYAGNTAASLEDNGLFVLPDPPSDGGQPGAHGSVERDQADALEALNSATEVNVSAAAAPAPRSTVTTTSAVATAAPAGEAVYTGEHPPPGYDEAVGMVPSRRDQQKAALPVPAAAAVAPVLPPRRAGAGGQFAANGQPEAAAGLSLAERYGLPVADI